MPSCSPRKSPTATAPGRQSPHKTPANAFCEHYLRRSERLDEPSTATEAEFAGPWQARSLGGTTAMLRTWEDLHWGDQPFAHFHDDQAAQLALALLPARGRLGTYRLSSDPDTHGFPVARNGQPIGHLAYFDEHFVEALSVLEALIKNPPALAQLLQAAGPTALEQTGRILYREMEGGGPETSPSSEASGRTVPTRQENAHEA